MEILYYIMLVFHIVVSAALVLVVLAQSSKGGALDGMLGGVASSTLGQQGASDFMKKATRVLAFVFMLSSILLAVVVKNMNAMGQPKESDIQRKLREEATEEIAPAPTQEATGSGDVQFDVTPAPDQKSE